MPHRPSARVAVKRTSRHHLLGLLRQEVYGRLTGYEDADDVEQLARDPAMRAIVGRGAWTGRRPRPARRAASRPGGSQAMRTSRRSGSCPAPGSTGCTGGDRQTASFSTWTVPRARPMGPRRARLGTGASAHLLPPVLRLQPA